MCTADQVIVADQITQSRSDVGQLEPMLDALAATTKAASIRRRKPRAAVADAGYRRAENVDGSIVGAAELFIAVAKHGRLGKPGKDGAPTGSKIDHPVATMDERLATRRGTTTDNPRAGLRPVRA